MNIRRELIIKELMEPSLSELTDSDSTSSCSELSEDEEVPKKRKLLRILDYVEITVHNYRDDEFKAHMRLERTTAYHVIDLFQRASILPTHRDGRDKISAEKSFLLVLWYLSNQESFRQVSDRFNVTLSSAHRCLKRVLSFLLSITPQEIKWPNDEEADAIRAGFRSKKGIANVIGVIDGSHIEIPKPAQNQVAYINRKGYHSLLLQGIVDHRKRFIDVFCGEPGSMHDARLLRKSGIYAKIAANPNLMGEDFLLGDTAYPNLHWLVTPFKDNGRLNHQQRIFNYNLLATRVVVEHSFGLLKCRFRRLRKLENIDKNLCSRIIMAACTLHNICINGNDFIEADVVDFNQPEQAPHNIVANNIVEQNRQEEVMNRLFNR